jgi:hypothetical protein
LQRRHGRAILFGPASEGPVLQIMHPSFRARQDVHKLSPHRRMAKSWNLLSPQLVRHSGDMAQQQVHALVHQSMQFEDAVSMKHH